MKDGPFAPKPNAHQEAIAKLIQRYPDLTGRALYTRYLDTCPAFLSQEAFEKLLAEVKSSQD